MRYNKKLVACYLPLELVQQFQARYPRLATVFVQRAFIKAVQNKDFFDDVFYKTFDKYSDLGKNNPRGV